MGLCDVRRALIGIGLEGETLENLEHLRFSHLSVAYYYYIN